MALMADVIQWDVMTWQRCLPFWHDVIEAKFSGSLKVLLLGERDGGLALWYALLGHRVTCTDLNGPTPAARELHKRYGVSDVIEYADASVFAIPFDDNSFDVVGCKSVIGGLKLTYADAKTRTLENQQLAVNEIARVLKEGGVYLGAENLVGSPLHRALRRLAKGEQIGWRHLTTEELHRLLARFDQVRVEQFGVVGTRAGRQMVNAVANRLDDLLRVMLPKSWLYVASFAATKPGVGTRVQ